MSYLFDPAGDPDPAGEPPDLLEAGEELPDLAEPGDDILECLEFGPQRNSTTKTTKEKQKNDAVAENKHRKFPGPIHATFYI